VSEVKTRQEHPPEFKAKVGLEALRGVKTINEIGQEHGVHPVQVGQWKKAIQERAKTLFEGNRGPKPVAAHRGLAVLYSEVGKLKIELDWRKKIRDQPVLARRAWIEPEEGVPVVQPCVLAGVCRGHDPCATKATDRRSSRPAAHEPVGTLRPGAGSAHLSAAPGAPGLSLPAAWGGGGPAQPGLEHRHHVPPAGSWFWLPGGDHRRVVPQSPQLAHQDNMDAVFCVDCLEEALRTHGKPEIFNSDQGAQFTREAFTNVLTGAGIGISSDGRGRVFDNLFVERLWRRVKHEDVSLKGYATMDEPRVGLAEYFAFYNSERAHQSLGQQTPEGVYRTALAGGAKIVDQFAGAGGETPAEARATAQSNSKPNKGKTGAAPSSCW
jgi:putative transposase